MFEKEAEEWVKENMDCCKTDNSVNQSIPYFDEEERCCAKSAFQDGAEFGYNKAKIEVEESYRESLCNSELNLASVTEQLEELEKANEWHYCKDELPDHNGQFYVALKGHTETFICTYDYDEEDDSKMIWFDDDYNVCDEVYAWQEKLKAPKESE